MDRVLCPRHLASTKPFAPFSSEATKNKISYDHTFKKNGVTETFRNITARVIERDISGEINYFLEDSRGFRTRQNGRQSHQKIIPTWLYRQDFAKFSLNCHYNDRDPMTVIRIWNRWIQDGNTKHRAGSQRSPITYRREDRHVTHMALMDLRRRLQQHGLSARRPWLRLPLTLHHRQERLQWRDQRRTWTNEWRDVIFSDEPRFYLQHQDGHIHVWRHHGDRILAECIRHRHSGPSSSEMVLGAV
ncbi:transposable element Tcb1 transposase [Trichonephila clavipes]|nr:transposable element Tcb1 transposase [Trichonephila clavipes]